MDETVGRHCATASGSDWPHMEHEIVLGFAGLAFTTGGAAWAGVKLSLNGMRGSIGRIEKAVERIDGQVQDNRNEISSVKARCVAFHGDN